MGKDRSKRKPTAAPPPPPPRTPPNHETNVCQEFFSENLDDDFTAVAQGTFMEDNGMIQQRHGHVRSSSSSRNIFETDPANNETASSTTTSVRTSSSTLKLSRKRTLYVEDVDKNHNISNTKGGSSSLLVNKRTCSSSRSTGADKALVTDSASLLLPLSSVLAPPTAMTSGFTGSPPDSRIPTATRMAKYDDTGGDDDNSRLNHHASSSLFGAVMMRSVSKLQAHSHSSSGRSILSSGDDVHCTPPPPPTLTDQDPAIDNEYAGEALLRTKKNSPATPLQQPTKTAPANSAINRTHHHYKNIPSADASPTTKALTTSHSFTTPQAAGKNQQQTGRTEPTVFSPQGFQMMQVINQAEDSPFQIMQQPRQISAAVADDDDDQDNKEDDAKPQKAPPRHAQEWYDLKLVSPPTGQENNNNNRTRLVLPVLDWSLKDQFTITMELQQQLARRLLSRFLAMNASIEQDAHHRFFLGQPIKSSSMSLMEELETRFAQSLLYWQYPPNGYYNDGDGDTAKTKKSSGGKVVLVTKAPRNHALVVRRNNSNMGYGNNMLSASSSSIIMKGMKDNDNDKSRFGSGLTPRRHTTVAVWSRLTVQQVLAWKELPPPTTTTTKKKKEWQDAFWSLYGKWRMAVATLCPKRTTLEEVTRTCFYAVGRGHSVLFRVVVAAAAAAMQQQPPCPPKNEQTTQTDETKKKSDTNTSTWEEDDDDESIDESWENDEEAGQRTWKFTPQIIFSSSSVEARNKLRQMGANLTFLKGPGGMDSDQPFSDEDKYWEIWEKQTTPVKKAKDSAEFAAAANSPSIQAELVALRRAQAMGHTVGADITVKTQNNPKNHPAGGGGANRMRRPRPRNLPPLVVSGDADCAVFAELYLNLCGCLLTKEPPTDDEDDDNFNHLQPHPVLLCRNKSGPFLHSSLKQLRLQRLVRLGTIGFHAKGFILPCAMREMMQTTFDIMSLEVSSEDKGSWSNGKSNENDDAEGNGKLLTRCRVHKGYESTLTEGAIGSPSTILFNKNNESYDNLGCRNDRNMLVCRFGEIALDGIVEINRPSLLSIKVNRIPPASIA